MRKLAILFGGAAVILGVYLWSRLSSGEASFPASPVPVPVVTVTPVKRDREMTHDVFPLVGEHLNASSYIVDAWEEPTCKGIVMFVSPRDGEPGWYWYDLGKSELTEYVSVLDVLEVLEPAVVGLEPYRSVDEIVLFQKPDRRSAFVIGWSGTSMQWDVVVGFDGHCDAVPDTVALDDAEGTVVPIQIDLHSLVRRQPIPWK